MKRFISLFLLVAISTTMFIGSEISVNAEVSYCHLSKYKSVFKKVYKSCYKDKDYIDKSRAFYYDFDNNGQKELVMIATKKKSDKIGAYLYLYTIKGGKVKAIIKNRCLAYYSNEECPAQIGLSKKDGKEYLFVRKVTTDSETVNKSTINLYSISGSKATCKHTAVSTAKYNKKSEKWEVTTKLNKKKKSNSFFMKWQNSFKLTFVNKKKVSDGYKKYSYYNNPITDNLYKASETMSNGLSHFKKEKKSKTFDKSKFKNYDGPYNWYYGYSGLVDDGFDGTFTYHTDYVVDEAGRYHWDEFGHFWTDKDLDLI